jgi:hypothetical protein
VHSADGSDARSQRPVEHIYQDYFNETYSGFRYQHPRILKHSNFERPKEAIKQLKKIKRYYAGILVDAIEKSFLAILRISSSGSTTNSSRTAALT